MESAKVADLCAASFCGNIAALQAVLIAGVDVNAFDATGMTALTRAAIAGHEKVVGILLAAKADVMKRDQVRAARSPVSRRLARTLRDNANTQRSHITPPLLAAAVWGHCAALCGLLRV